MKLLLLSFLLILFSSFTYTAQSSNYTGDLNGKKINGTLTFKKDETVTGSYYFVSRPDRVYKVYGTNFVNGEIEVDVYLSGKKMSSGTLTKSLTNSYIIWEGRLWDNANDNDYLTLRRPR